MAQLARSYYVLSSRDSPDWKVEVSRTRLEEDPPIEAPIFPAITAAAYHLAGGEHLLIPRLFSSLFWLAGAVFLYLLAVRFVRAWAAVIPVAIYLFLPFPLVASTSFQPDPLMVSVLVAALLALVRHHEHPTWERLLVAAAVSGLAVFIKPGMAAFFLFPAFAALAFPREGVLGAVRAPASYFFAGLALLPAIGFYAYSMISEQFVQQRIQLSVNPAILDNSFFWRDWLTMITDVVRPPFLGDLAALLLVLVALSAVFVARGRAERALLIGLWVGYAVFGLVVTNYVSTHNYYSLPLVPITALSVGVVANAVGEWLRHGARMRWAASAAVGLAVTAAVFVAVRNPGSVVSLGLNDEVNERRVAIYEDIGPLVHHTSRALVLGGTGLWHHAWLAGRYWPGEGDLEWEQTYNGLRRIDADERFRTTDERYYPAVGTMRPSPTFFIVAEPIELARQLDLAVLLSDFRLLAGGPNYAIFDLTRRASGVAPDLGGALASAGPSPASASFYRFPPAWGQIERGLTRVEVRRRLGSPSRIEDRGDLRKPVESWFYGPNDAHAVVFVDQRLFVKASSIG